MRWATSVHLLKLAALVKMDYLHEWQKTYKQVHNKIVLASQ